MPIKWSISNSDTKAVITMKFEDYSPEIQAKLMEIGNAAADAVELSLIHISEPTRH